MTTVLKCNNPHPTSIATAEEGFDQE